jgi:hypothetical protein
MLSRKEDFMNADRNALFLDYQYFAIVVNT